MSAVASVTPISVAYPESNDAGFTRYLTLCRIESTDGVVGWGECIPMSGSGFPEACRATEVLIQGLADLIIGSDPVANLATVDKIKKRTWWYGPEGIAAFALSAIDMALWDLKGKVLGRPLVDLLGGAVRKDFPAIAATHATLSDIEAEAARHGDMIRAGFAGVKVGFSERSGGLGFNVERDINFMRLLREACGPDAQLMIDRGQSLRWDVSSAIRRIRGFEEYGLLWIEEPLEPSDIEGFRRIRQTTTTLIATGEREWHMRGYHRLLGEGVVDVVGCDPGRSEGVTGFQQLVKLVEQHNLWFNAHSWSSAINTAASLAVSATSHRALTFELKPEENPMQHELVDTPFEARDGVVHATLTKPGLGIEVNEAVVRKYEL
ncbi:MAG TPA: mandelate racemase/muconate lactonizing enzyme family protein [Acidimicrobiia bacterium]|nr:mandelate racemase/muconate lactonizing enzyme family protein [Acidimicrobiia bacterium]